MLIILLCLMVAISAATILRVAKHMRFRKITQSPAFKQKKVSAINDYNSYSMSALEITKCYAMANIILIATGFFFFRNVYICLALCSLSAFYPSLKRKSLIRQRKKELCLQFKDALQSVAASLSAGRSIEGAFRAAVDDLKILYQSDNIDIIKELELINRRVEMNDTLKNALLDFAERADIDDIRSFVDVFAICKISGGNLVEVIKNTCSVINQKIDILNEIDVIVAEQRFSQRILNVMPFALMILIITSSSDYVRPLYTPLGNFVMLIVLVLLVISYFISTKIMDIKV